MLSFCVPGFDVLAQTANNDVLGRAQSSEISFNLRPGASTGKNYVRNMLPKDKIIEYQRYLHEEALPTMILLIKGDTVKGHFRYNLETETLESALGDSLIEWSYVFRFEFMETTEKEAEKYSNLKVVWPESEYGGFVQDVSTSPFVKVKHYLEFIPKSYDPSTQLGDKNDQIVPKTQQYLKVDDKWIEIPETKTAFFDLFGRYSEDLRKYARKNKLKVKNPEDVGKMVSWVTRNRN